MKVPATSRRYPPLALGGTQAASAQRRKVLAGTRPLSRPTQARRGSGPASDFRCAQIGKNGSLPTQGTKKTKKTRHAAGWGTKIGAHVAGNPRGRPLMPVLSGRSATAATPHLQGVLVLLCKGNVSAPLWTLCAAGPHKIIVCNLSRFGMFCNSLYFLHNNNPRQ